MRVHTVTTAITTDTAGRVVESLPVFASDVPIADATGHLQAPVDMTEDAAGTPIRIVAGNVTTNSAGQQVDAIPGKGVGGPASYLGPVADNVQMFTGTLGSVSRIQARTPHTAADDITAIQLCVANWFAAGGSETATSASASFTASIEYNGVYTQLGSSGAIAAGAEGVTALTTVPKIPKGATFFTRVDFVMSSGDAPYIGADEMRNGPSNGSRGAIINLFGWATNFLTGDNTGGSNDTFVAWTPTIVLGTTKRPSIAMLGDSRVFGAYEGSGYDASGEKGFAARAFGSGNFGYINLGCSGEMLTNAAANFTKRKRLVAYCSHIFSAYGINDIVFGGRSAAQVRADLVTFAALFSGKDFTVATIGPKTTSSDSWATVANQTVDATNGVRTTYNDALRAGLPAGISRLMECADAVESARNSGKWKANYSGNYSSGNGIHETLTGAIAEAVAIDITKFVR